MDDTASSNSTLKNHRNYCLLFFEIVACIFIIFIHISFPGKIGYLLSWFARFGVPLFFVVAGYYMIRPNTDKASLRRKMKKRIIHVSILLLFSALLYFTISIFLNRNDLSSFFIKTFSIRNLLYFILLNRPFFSAHNWFLLAMLYSYIIVYLFPWVFLGKNWRLICIVSILIVTIVLHIMSYQIDTIFEEKDLRLIAFRNWFFNGLPFIALGILLKKNEYLFEKIKTTLIVVVLTISCILMVVEMYLYGKFLNAEIEFNFFNIVFVVFIIALSTKVPKLFSSLKLLNMKESWTTYVYVFHPAIITLVSGVFVKSSLDNYQFAPYIKPIIVVLFSIFLAILFSLIIGVAKKRMLSSKCAKE